MINYSNKYASYILLLLTLSGTDYVCCNWITDWLSLSQSPTLLLRSGGNISTINQMIANLQHIIRQPEEKDVRHIKSMLRSEAQGMHGQMKTLLEAQNFANIGSQPKQQTKEKLEVILSNVNSILIEVKRQMKEIQGKEYELKEAIVNGINGTTVVEVTPLGKISRQYFIRNGQWSTCDGIIRHPEAIDKRTKDNLFLEYLKIPKCTGQMVDSKQDDCAFNSVIKYETIPNELTKMYREDEFLCLKYSFDNTVQQFMSVPKHVVGDTCKKGVILTLKEKSDKCGDRTLVEYSYYPDEEMMKTSKIATEYCVSPDRSCKLMVAWHITDKSTNNFAFLRDDQSFKSIFMSPGKKEM